jgi:hypothetical protein
MSRDVCGICWCPYDDDGKCGCKPQGPVIGLDVYLDPDDGLKPKLYADRQRHKDEALLRQALEALEIGREYAHQCAEQFHVEMRGYRQQRHQVMDADVKELDNAIAALQERLKERLK